MNFIQVYSHFCPNSTVLMSHLAAVMNFITANYAVSVFPRSTFIQRVSFIARLRTNNRQNWIEKYEKRGFTVIGGQRSLTSKHQLKLGKRCTLDNFCWTIKFQGIVVYVKDR